MKKIRSIQLDFDTQWKDSYIWDIINIGFYNDASMFSIDFVLFGLCFSIDFFINRK